MTEKEAPEKKKVKKQPEHIIGVGRRKSAVASVFMKKGKGEIRINGREFDAYFPIQGYRDEVISPLNKLNLAENYDLHINVKGGGPHGQAIACRHGLARALVKQDEDRRAPLKEMGFMTRDPRKKERKKYGQPGARKKFQFSKR